MNAPEETAAEETAEVVETEVEVEAEAEEAAPAPLPVPTGRPVQTVGRRKEAVVRVRLVPGNGGFKLNGKTLEQYFPNKVHQQIVKEPLVTVERLENFDVLATLRGGGPSGQAGALRMAIARALVAYDGDDRPALKKAGMLTRDAREKERKKYGLKKARKAPQFSKR
ncbi:30S ribosomal protein S9 [Saccharopolyspora indica]|uniref:30S ribosomal protein S9 n=1 Tax=Saccharopolyspora indica TaxID=1229659 RepID=UPI003565A851